jgi:hypothetical protein
MTEERDYRATTKLRVARTAPRILRRSVRAGLIARKRPETA